MTNIGKPIICVYKITSPSKKVYIGSTIHYKERLRAYHRLDCKKQHKLLNSFKKYGVQKHKFEILCHCDLIDVRQKEAYYGNLFNCLGRQGLNCRLPYHGEGFSRTSEETRKKIGLSKKGNQNNKGRKFSEETRRKQSDAQKLRIRNPHSEITKIRMRDKAMGGRNHNAKILLNIQTGIFYECFMDAANSLGMNYNTFRSNIYKKKQTPFIIAA